VRGFNLDHGTDFAVAAEGVPINMRTHGHGQGYLDLNFLIPELVETMSYRKGTYAAEVGDFSSAASAEFTFYDKLPESIATLTFGEYGYGRGLIANSSSLGSGTLTGAIDVTAYDGPWDIEEDLEQLKFYLNYGVEAADGQLSFSLQGYDSSWNSSDQIPKRAVESGLIDDDGFIDPDLGGDTHRYTLSVNADFEYWEAVAYYVDYELSLISNFTYLLGNPITGDQFEQVDDRNIFGGKLTGFFERSLFERPAYVQWGGELRYDDINEVGLYSTVARTRVDTIRKDAVEQFSVGGFAELELAISDRFRAVAGIRADYFDWDVNAEQTANSGTGDDDLISPKLSLSYSISDAVETYASWGQSFHSNDVRGATITVDPVTSEPVDPVDVLVSADGAEIGIRLERSSDFNLTLVGFWLELDSELVYVGDAGTVEPSDKSERLGIELASFWQVTDVLSLNAAYTYTDAKFETDTSADAIPGTVESTFVLGANAVWSNGFKANARLRWLSDPPLTEDGSVTAESSLLVNAGVAYRRGPAEARVDIFNLLDSNDDDISYYYASRLDGEPAEGVEDIHFHPLEPRAVRASITYHW
jgi:hypothetical protein